MKQIWLCLCIGVWGTSAGNDARPQDGKAVKEAKPLVVGWNDECNRPNWQSFPKPNAPDTSLRHKGFLGLRLGHGVVSDPPVAPFLWASVWRIAEVNTERYPIMAVRGMNLKGASWWDCIVQGYDDTKGLIGKEIKTPSLDHDGVILFDLQTQTAKGLDLSTGKIRVRLCIAGTQKGGSVEYDWIRFVRRSDAELLRDNPRLRDIVVEP